MILRKSPNRWSCLATSAAMVLDCSIEYLIEKLGHDGSTIHWPSLPEPFNRQSFHIEELQYVAFGFHKLFVPFVPAFEYNPGADERLPFAKYLFTVAYKSMLSRYDGILVGHWSKGHPHAVAWNAKERLIYDPEGSIHDQASAFVTEQFYAAVNRT